MPIYEYACLQCDAKREHLVKINAPAFPCPACGSSDYRRMVSAGSFILKGSGWYQTDFKNKKAGSK